MVVEFSEMMHIMCRVVSTSKYKITDHFLGARHTGAQLCCGLLTRQLSLVLYVCAEMVNIL